MEIKFTPGPWSCVQLGDGYEVLMGEHASMITGKDVLYMEDDKHNAHLIAAAPDLYEALKLALEYWNHRQKRYKNRSPVWVQEARAAMAKARGEQP